jgi:uncharacterized protein YigE (DUF2233 family)
MKTAAIRLLGPFLACLSFWPAGASASCRSERFEGSSYTVCSFDLTKSDIRLFWLDGEGAPFSSFSALAEELRGEGKTLDFAMNGGMYAADLSPVGLYVEHGSEMKAVNTADAEGNFHLKPNGVFYVGGGTAGVMETGAYLERNPKAEFATQSGPMLVIDGKLHPRFIPASPYRKRRDGVGVSSPTTVHFAISDGLVNFDEFARLFRDRLGCQNALFLDGGSAPGLYAPELSRNDSWSNYGPIIGVVE